MEVKHENTEVTFTGFTEDQAKHFNQMNLQCKKRKINVPDIINGETTTTLQETSNWLFYQGTLTGSKEEFEVYSVFSKAYHEVKWEQTENSIKVLEYK